MSRDEDKLIRQLSLLSFLLSQRRPFTAREVQESVEGYSEMSDETFARRFSGDRTDLAKIGIQIKSLSDTGSAESQAYYLPQEDFRLPSVEFTQVELRALALALATLDSRFAYARPLRLALTAIFQGHMDQLSHDLERLPVALAPDEDALKAGKQLARLEDAVTRGKTVSFLYPSGAGDPEERTLDPYSLFFMQGRWYVVGSDHTRRAIRTFRVGRIRGTVRFLTEKARDFSVPPDYDPREYRARPPWLIGPVRGSAAIKVTEDLAWWVARLQPHVAWLGEDCDGCTRFSVPYADERVLLSWVVGLGGCAELLEPTELRERLGQALSEVRSAHEGAVSEEHTATGRPPPSSRPALRYEGKSDPIPPEHLARAIALLHYLVDERRPGLVTWRSLENDLGLTRAEAEADLSLINLVNFGGGTYALTAEADDDGVRVTRDVMADTFAHPARLSPVMARALLLALDLLGDALALEGMESVTSVRDKVCSLVGADGQDSTIIVDDLLPPDPEIVEVLNHAIRDHQVVALDYFTSSRQELGERRIEPYLLFRSRDGWYLEAYCLKTDAQRTFKLERIRSARPTGAGFTVRPGVDLSLRHSGLAFSPEDAVTWATVRFDPRWHSYLEDRGADCRPRTDGSLEVRMPYHDENWIAREILRYLGDAVLEHPASARRLVRELASTLVVRYRAERAIRPGTGPAEDGP
jgi:predicted DNA-binding transcriptional regulator YafY